MPDPAVTALSHVVSRLHDPSTGVHAHLCEGSPADAVAWGSADVTVRCAARGGDEVWVFAGSALLLRVVADSEGGFDDLEAVVRGILQGRARELLVQRGPATVARGYDMVLETGARYAGGLAVDDADGILPLVGHVASLPQV